MPVWLVRTALRALQRIEFKQSLEKLNIVEITKKINQ
jgi:hypothetical protein